MAYKIGVNFTSLSYDTASNAGIGCILQFRAQKNDS